MTVLTALAESKKKKALKNGIKLLSAPKGICRDKELQIKQLLYPNQHNQIRECQLSELIFADDTTEFEEVSRDDAKKCPNTIAPGLAEYFKVIDECALKENVSKRIYGPLLDLVGRNLGMDLSHAKDIETKISKAWKKFYVMRSKISGCPEVSQKDKADITLVSVRCALTDGLTSRSITQSELKTIEKVENAIMMRSLNRPRWKLRIMGMNLSDLRLQTLSVPIRTFINYHRARLFGHIMRAEDTLYTAHAINEKRDISDEQAIERPERDTLAKRAILGRLFPSQDSTDLKRNYFDDVAILPGAPPKKKKRWIDDVYEWLTHGCGIPEEAIDSLVEKNLDMKSLYYQITRERFIREAINDWALGNKSSVDDILEAADFLCKNMASLMTV